MKPVSHKIFLGIAASFFCALCLFWLAPPLCTKAYTVPEGSKKVYADWINKNKADLYLLVQLVKTESNLKDIYVSECANSLGDLAYFTVINGLSTSSLKKEKGCTVRRSTSLKKILARLKINEKSFEGVDSLSKKIGITHLHIVERRANRLCIAVDPFILSAGSDDYIYFFEGAFASGELTKKGFVKLEDNWYVGEAILR